MGRDTLDSTFFNTQRLTHVCGLLEKTKGGGQKGIPDGGLFMGKLSKIIFM